IVWKWKQKINRIDFHSINTMSSLSSRKVKKFIRISEYRNIGNRKTTKKKKIQKNSKEKKKKKNRKNETTKKKKKFFLKKKKKKVWIFFETGNSDFRIVIFHTNLKKFSFPALGNIQSING